MLTIKTLRKTDESLTIVMSFSAIGSLMALPLVNFEDFERAFHSWSLLVAALSVAALAFVGHVFHELSRCNAAAGHRSFLACPRGCRGRRIATAR